MNDEQRAEQDLKELREIQRAKAAFEDILRETLEQRTMVANANNLPTEQNNSARKLGDNSNSEYKL